MKDNQAKYPQLRFKGYSDAWVQRKLGENATILTGGTPKTTEPSYWEPKEIPWMSSGEVNKKRLESTDNMISEIGLENSSARWVKEHSILIALAGQGKTRGMVAINNIPLTTNQSIAAIEPNESLDYEFVFQNLGNRYDELRMSSSGDGTRGGLNKKIISDILVSAPDIDEQKQIGKLFASLDNLIAANQRKLDLLKEQKKGYLQKMFPKNGAKVPELRFAGFADDWEERKLSDLFIKGGSGGTPKSTNKAFYDGDIPFLSISDITKSNGFINNTEKHISSDGLNSSAAWIVSKGAISLAMYASVGKLAILNIDAATSQAFYNMIFDDYDLRDLVYQRLNKANELSEWNKLISTGTQSNLNADKVKNFQMYLPKNHDEIKLISTFFQQLDNTIALHQRKLDLLKEQKKGFLQNMFV